MQLLAEEVVGEVAVETAEWVACKVEKEVEKEIHCEGKVDVSEAQAVQDVAAGVECPNRYW